MASLAVPIVADSVSEPAITPAAVPASYPSRRLTAYATIKPVVATTTDKTACCSPSLFSPRKN